MTRLFVAFGLCVGFLAVAGCDNNPPPMVDAYVPLPDAPPIVPSILFGRCTQDAECAHLGEGAICRAPETGPAGGYCTLPCSDRTPCDAFGSYHHCITLPGETQSYCVMRCRNGIDCARDSWSCDDGAAPDGMDGVCVSVCENDAECGGGAVCNVESGQCEAPPLDTSGTPHGTACASGATCRSGACITEGTRTAPSGWVGGMCVGPCRLPAGFNTTNFFSGDTLPQAGCVDGAVCIPQGQNGLGDLGTCYAECTGDADCRPGFGCLRSIRSHMFTNGICVPAECRSSGCPAGYTCAVVTQSDGSQVGRCAPGA